MQNEIQVDQVESLGLLGEVHPSELQLSAWQLAKMRYWLFMLVNKEKEKTWQLQKLISSHFRITAAWIALLRGLFIFVNYRDCQLLTQ